MDIKEIAKKYTRSEFLNTYGGYCPSKFELENSENCEDEKWSCYNCLKEATKGIKFKDDIEGDKMEDKTIKVRCIDKRFYDNLTINKEYEVLEETENRYRIINNEKGCTLYPKELFKKVEDTLMVECVDNEGYEKDLILGKIYPVKDQNEYYYFIKDEIFSEKVGVIGYAKTRFKPVEPQKEIKEEYTLQEIFQEKEGIIFNNADAYFVIENGVLYSWFKYKEEKESVRLTKMYVFMKFTKVEEQQEHIEEESVINHMKAFREITGKENSCYNEEYEKLKKENEEQSVKITLLEQDNKEYEHANKGLAEESADRLKTIKKLQRAIEDNKENAKLRNRVEDLENINKDINNTRELIHEEMIKLANENEGLKKIAESAKNTSKRLDEVEEENYKLRCQYEETQKVANSFEIMADKYSEKQKAMESNLIKYESTIKSLKETIKGLASLL